MKKLLLAFFALTVLLAGCGQDQVAGGTVKPEPKGEPIEIGEDSYLLGETVVYENVAVVPLIAKDYEPIQEADYITLAEATKNDWIEIVEKPGGEMVSELTVRYSGPKPLLLLAGELLLGGKQDRIVAEDTVIDPISTVVVSVYCVEPGRWSGSSRSFGFSGGQAPSNVKQSALLGSQSDVWEETGEFNAYAGVPMNARSTVDSGLSSREVSDFTDKGKNGLRSAIEGYDGIVGLVFVINGEIHSLELFGAPRLLVSSFDSITSGILAEASVRQQSDFELPTNEALRAFLEDVLLVRDEALSTTSFTTHGVVPLGGYSMDVDGAMIQGKSAGAPAAHGTFYNKKD